MLTVLSAKASPGVTTTALLLAAALPTPAVLVEADPAGGSLGPRFGLGDEPGLRTLAVRARRDLDPAMVADHTQPVGSVAVVVGPPTADEADAVLSTAIEPLVDVLSTMPSVVVDAGRTRPGAPTWSLIRRSACCVVVCRPCLDEFRPAAGLATELKEAGVDAGFVCRGSAPYAPVEFAAEAGVELLGVLPEDPRGAAALRGEPCRPRTLERSSLWLAGRTLVERVRLIDHESAVAR